MMIETHEMAATASVLAPPARNRLFEWLDEGVDSGGERYLELRRRLVEYFDRHDRARAGDLADETFRRVARALEHPGAADTTPPARYCYQVAKSVLLEDARRPSVTPPPGRAGAEELTIERDNIDRLLRQLPAADRDLIVEYYGRANRRGTDHRRRIAERLGVTSNDLRIRAFRIRETLMINANGQET
jgi:DNA-directed RNA polymerase specialized sigma24 family protein